MYEVNSDRLAGWLVDWVNGVLHQCQTIERIQIELSAANAPHKSHVTRKRISTALHSLFLSLTD